MVFTFKRSLNCPYLSSTPGLEVPLSRVFSDLFSFGLHMASHRTSTSVALARLPSRGATAHDARSSLQRSAHDQTEVSLSLLPIVASPHMPCGFRGCGSFARRSSSPSGSRQQECLRRSAIKLSSNEWGRIEGRLTPLLLKRGQVGPHS